MIKWNRGTVLSFHMEEKLFYEEKITDFFNTHNARPLIMQRL